MRFAPICIVASLLAASSAVPAFAAKPKAKHIKPSSHAKATPAKSKFSSLSIDSDRASHIQTALIGAGYMAGQPSGTWDANTVAAMGKFQADNGWQTKIVPDSRAIIKLGLGSSYAPATYLAPATTAETENTATPVDALATAAANK